MKALKKCTSAWVLEFRANPKQMGYVDDLVFYAGRVGLEQRKVAFREQIHVTLPIYHFHGKTYVVVVFEYALRLQEVIQRVSLLLHAVRTLLSSTFSVADDFHRDTLRPRTAPHGRLVDDGAALI